MQRLYKVPIFNHSKTLSLTSRLPINRLATMSAAKTDGQAAEVANNSGITPISLQLSLTEKLKAQHVYVEDISGKQKYTQ